MTEQEMITKVNQYAEKLATLEAYKAKGKAYAEHVQAESPNMTGTEIIAERTFIPYFTDAVANENMENRPLGFLVKHGDYTYYLIQKYNSETFPSTPDVLVAQWGYKWSTDPNEATEFISFSTSPYNMDDCCLWQGEVYRCITESTIFSPEAMPTYWEVVSDF